MKATRATSQRRAHPNVHGAKGLEFDLVIIADAVDGRFPQHARASTLLSPSRPHAAARARRRRRDRDRRRRTGGSVALVCRRYAHEDAACSSPSRMKGLMAREQRPSRFLTGTYPGRTRRRSRAARWRSRRFATATRRGANGSCAAAHRRSPSANAYARRGRAAFPRLETRPLPLPEKPFRRRRRRVAAVPPPHLL